ncbi:voltage-gated potassium channel [Sparassis latifolia]
MSQSIPLTRIGTPRVSSPHLSTPPSGARYVRVNEGATESPDREVFPESFDDMNDLDQQHQSAWKRSIYMLLEQPTSSQAAFLVLIVTTSLIVISAVVTVLETIPSFHSINPSVWFGLETALVALFTVEYVARCLAHSGSWKKFLKWFGSFFGIIDLLGILPYYIEVAMGQDTSTFFRFTILRTFRLLRVFRPFRYNNTILLTIEVMYLSFRRSQHALLALLFFVLMVLVVFSTLLYFVERGTWDENMGMFVNSDGDPSQFSSIPAAAWFVLETITTVGFGEITPRSFLGRLITIPLLIFGLLLIALPTFVLGREFSMVWEAMHQNQTARTEVFDAGLDQLPSPELPRTRSIQDIRAEAASGLWRHSNETSLRLPPPGVGAAELSAQVAELRAALEMQGLLLRRVVDAVEGRRKVRVPRAQHNEDAARSEDES